MKMKRNEFIRYSVSAFSAALIPRFLFGNSALQKLPNVLLLGDSISIGYTPFVRELLKAKANVFRPVLENGNPENCEGTTKGIVEINRWIGTGDWDIIHFNFGLHDIKHVHPSTGETSSDSNDPLQASLDQYVKNMNFIVERLKNTGAKLIFATTTPVPDGNLSTLREPENVIKYNKAARKIMKKEHIAVNDLYAFTLPKLKEIQKSDNVHFTDAGNEVIAREVAAKISELML